MDHDRLALFLLGYTTGGFRRALRASPQATLVKCGFNSAEAALIAAATAKHSRTLNTNEITRVQLTFQQITYTNKGNNTGMSDDWSSRC